MGLRRPAGRTGQPATVAGRRRRSPAAVLLAGVVAVMLATGCVGQRSRNDDHVGPFSYRPDAREHR